MRNVPLVEFIRYPKCRGTGITPLQWSGLFELCDATLYRVVCREFRIRLHGTSLSLRLEKKEGRFLLGYERDET